MTKTASGLVEYCRAQLGKPYWWGTFGQTATVDLYNALKAQWPKYYTANDFQSQYGKRVHDCVGLVKGYRWSDSPTSVPRYNTSQDFAVPGLYSQCNEHGTIASIRRTITGHTQAEVAKKVREIESLIDSQSYIQPEKTTVGQWLNEWADTYLTNIAMSSKNHYKYICDKYLIPELGNKQLQKLTPVDIQRFVNVLVSRGLSEKYVKDIHGVLRRALGDAESVAILIPDNPAKKTKLPKIVKKDPYIPETSDLVTLLRAISKHKHESIYKLGLFLGLREGELLGLQWDCIDFERGTITVRQQLCRERKKGGQYYFSPTKGRTTRILTMPESVIEMLKAQKLAEDKKKCEAGELWEGKNLVFSNDVGGYLSYRTVYDCFRRLLKKEGIRMRVHDLRHAFATISIENGDDVKTVQANLGHTTSELTLQVYAHTTQGMKKRSAERMENKIMELGKMV